MVRRLKPIKPDPVPTSQCELVLETKTYYPGKWHENRLAQYKAKGWDFSKCGHYAVYEIDGVCLCSQHAGIRAIKILMEQERARLHEG